MPLNDLMAAVSTRVLAAADRDSALRAAAGMLACREAAEDALFHSLRERESVGSTAIGHGIAIPHGRSSTLQRPRGVLLRLQRPVDFGGSEPVDLVFAMAVPEHYTHQHLMLLSELAEIFSDAHVRDALRAAADGDALKRILDHPPRTPAP
ncbi:PTS fructose transporter subunit IIA [Stenotrophomonas daejeonensis]|uniref:PTS fructose transporter subunit IIA n=1 Tax=Stenotrophomonas daejeonensis TaxID=659018 RepID=A0A0R0E2V5_9GAMM|nr:PTS sugar transporter subunit IIA [Stenotrophomonas daejeonensis]KRG88246.1 PTS fructose transporter subunit IIA [Stenotrophomonas daejeonensis]